MSDFIDAIIETAIHISDIKNKKHRNGCFSLVLISIILAVLIFIFTIII